MTKPDKVLLGAIIALAILSYVIYISAYRESAELTTVISVNGEFVTEVDLNSLANSRLINISGPLGTSVVEVKPGAIRMEYSPCPDRYCMETGWINQPGQVIVCVPNRIVIKICPDKNTVETISQ